MQAAAVTAARAAVARARYSLDCTVLVAPVRGRVAPLIVRVGDYLTAGRPVVAIVSDENWLFAGVFLFSLIHQGTSRWVYVGTQGGVAFILALVTGMGPPDSMMPAVNRIAGMLCGVGILLCVCLVFGYAEGSRSPTPTRDQTSSLNDSIFVQS